MKLNNFKNYSPRLSSSSAESSDIFDKQTLLDATKEFLEDFDEKIFIPTRKMKRKVSENESR